MIATNGTMTIRPKRDTLGVERTQTSCGELNSSILTSLYEGSDFCLQARNVRRNTLLKTLPEGSHARTHVGLSPNFHQFLVEVIIGTKKYTVCIPPQIIHEASSLFERGAMTAAAAEEYTREHRRERTCSDCGLVSASASRDIVHVDAETRLCLACAAKRLQKTKK